MTEDDYADYFRSAANIGSRRDDRPIMTTDRAGNGLVRPCAGDIDRDGFDCGGFDCGGCAGSSPASGAAACAGPDIVRKPVNGDAGDEVLASDPGRPVRADKPVRRTPGERKYEGPGTSENVSERIDRNDNEPPRRRAEELGGPAFGFAPGDIVNSDAVACSPASGGKRFLAAGANDGMPHITAEAVSPLDLADARLFGRYLEAYSSAGDALVARNSGARLCRDVNIVDGTRFSVPVNVPSVDDPCGGGGASYVLYGNWNFRNGTVRFDATDVNRFLLSGGRTYVDAEGNVRTVYSGDKATPEGPASTVEVTHQLPALRNSSWLRMY